MVFNKQCLRRVRLWDILPNRLGQRYITGNSIASGSRGFLSLSRFRSVMTRTSTPLRRLNHILNDLKPAPPTIGKLKLGGITYDVPVAQSPSRLPRSKDLLDIHDPVNVDNLHFMLQKYLLGQDIFLVSQPGPYARRLALTFARLVYCCLQNIVPCANHRIASSTQNMNT